MTAAVKQLKPKNKTYFFLLPNEITYRISQGEKLGAFRFDEAGKCTKVSINDALAYIKTFDIEKVTVTIDNNIVALEKKKEIFRIPNLMSLTTRAAHNRLF